MCGIVGFTWGMESADRPTDLPSTLDTMVDSLAHRGPDSRGTWICESMRIALGHRRLSILDLSELGAQPMHSPSGRYTMVFNGEVYNFREIRRALERTGCDFQGDSDTEVILQAFENWPLEQAVQAFVGMFAIGLWDRQERQLHLIRDRLGIKPMYWGWQGKHFLFGSELKALQHHPAWNPPIDREALASYFQLRFIPTPRSIFAGIQKQRPGTIVTIRPDRPNESNTQVYWSAEQVWEEGRRAPFSGEPIEAIAQLHQKLRDAVALRMISDVPVGAFLSAGIDSALVVALMQSFSTKPVQTFTIGFAEAEFDEAREAESIAKHLGTNHQTWYVDAAAARDAMIHLPRIFDEPFADSSQIPTLLVSQFARQQVTVSLSGDGGDELFAGYRRYFTAPRIWRATQFLPFAVRANLADCLGELPIRRLQAVLRRIGVIVPGMLKSRALETTVKNVIDVLGAKSFDEVHQRLTTTWTVDEAILRERVVGAERERMANHQSFDELIRRMMLSDVTTYLPDDILTKLDRSSMAVGLEARVPLIDHRVVGFAASLPLSMLIRQGQGKWMMRQLLSHYLPTSQIAKRKRGFSIPIGRWLRGPLREWASDLLSPSRIDQEGFLNAELVTERWRQHSAGDRDWTRHLWSVLMFQAWLDAQQSRVVSPALPRVA